MLYNQWKYNRGKYSTADLEEGLVPITMTSSVSCDCVRRRKSGATTLSSATTLASGEFIVSAQLTIPITSGENAQGAATWRGVSNTTSTSSSSATAGYVKEASATASASSSTSADSTKVREVDGQVSASATNTISAQRIGESGSLIMGDTVVSVVYIRKRNTTMISYGQSGTSSSCVRVIDASATISASSSISNISAIRVREGLATSSATVAITSNATSTYTSSGVVTSTVVVNSVCNRIRGDDLRTTILGSTATITVGREKWEVIPLTSTTWTTIAA